MTLPVIAFFNNKGGVGKTSLVYHVAWMYSEQGRRVLAADLDPQANLTAAFLQEDELEQIWQTPRPNQPQTIYDAVEPLMRGIGDIARLNPLYPTLDGVTAQVTLLVGDLALSNFEDDLSETWPKCLDSDERAFRVTSAFWRTLQDVAAHAEAELILMDLGPNLGAINRAALIAADYVVLPLVPDLFSMQGLRNLGPKLTDWRTGWQERLQKNRTPDLALPKGQMQPLGYVVMQPSVRLDRPVKAYDYWIRQIPIVYSERILGRPAAANESHQLGIIRHYHSLMPMAQASQKPVFLLKPADGAIGSHVQNVQAAYTDFETLAQRIDEVLAHARHLG